MEQTSTQEHAHCAECVADVMRLREAMRKQDRELRTIIDALQRKLQDALNVMHEQVQSHHAILLGDKSKAKEFGIHSVQALGLLRSFKEHDTYGDSCPHTGR